jgi:hypothetical protein
LKARHYLIIGLSICVLLLSGCANTPQAYQNQNILQMTPGPNGLPGAFPAPGANGIFGGSPAPYGAATPTSQLCPYGAAPDSTRADKIKSQLAGLKEIKDVNVVVIGNSCLVGYTPTAASTDPNATKNLVASRCKQVDSNIAGVTCGDTQDLNSRIAGITNDLRGSIPVGDMSSRFNDLVRVINPNIR